jgi:hypothetical protein
MRKPKRTPCRVPVKGYTDKHIAVRDRPWKVLTPGQRELRLDNFAAWHEREIFLDVLVKSEIKRIRQHAENANAQDMLLLVRAFKHGIDLGSVSMDKLRKTDFDKLNKAETIDIGEPDPELEKTLNAIIAKAAGIQPRPMKPASTASMSFTRHPDATPSEPLQEALHPEKPLPDIDLNQTEGVRRAAIGIAEEAFGINPEARDIGDDLPPKMSQAEIAAIRSKLVVGGKVRLDLEALSVYMLCPSYFAIATGLDPENWQAALLDSYAQRLGCLAARQSGKSLVVARKAICFALTNPATTTLILAPTLRQSSELLLKAAGVAQVAGLKLSSLSQFQLVLADKQPGASSRIISLPGSNEDSGASVRGYAADCLVLEEAAFLSDTVIAAVLPSIAARPKAQLIGISSAGIIGSYFHSVMTAEGSRWTKLIVPAEKSGRFSREQLDELKLTLGARYSVEMQCKWGMVGDSIYTSDVFDIAFGTLADEDKIDPVLDPELAFGHLDLDAIFAAQPFARRVA